MTIRQLRMCLISVTLLSSVAAVAQTNLGPSSRKPGSAASAVPKSPARVLGEKTVFVRWDQLSEKEELRVKGESSEKGCTGLDMVILIPYAKGYKREYQVRSNSDCTFMVRKLAMQPSKRLKPKL
jgi:hypothetical protein